jgi:secreted trypsin-like serine protease
MFLFLLIFSFLFINSISSTTYTCNTSISCGCSSVSTIVTSKIVGGEAAPNHAWEWIVSLQRSGSQSCGASLLTSEYAVTAGHCVNTVMNDFSMLSILAGTNYLTGDSSATIQRRSILKIYLHPNYDSVNVLNDIAILQFAPLSITSNSNLAFICLPEAYQDPFQVNTNLVAIGLGVTSEGSTTASNYLQQVTVQVFASTSTACQQAEIVNSTLQFCAGVSAGGKGMFYIHIKFLITFIFS